MISYATSQAAQDDSRLHPEDRLATPEVTATGDAPPPDQDGNPPCAAYDGWRPGPDAAGIAVAYWNAGPVHVTVLVRQKGGTDLSQTADIGDGERMHEFDFIDVDPTGESPKC